MSKITAIRRFQFSAGHRVYNHESKCSNLHGHNYVMYVHVEAPKLDSLGRVQDFGVMKSKFLPWIEKYWDHGFLWYEKDHILTHLFDIPYSGKVDPVLGFDAMKNFKCPFNPTAENMALYMLEGVGPALLANSEVKLVKVVLWETENCYVEASIDTEPVQHYGIADTLNLQYAT